jgi:hypothetical protein
MMSWQTIGRPGYLGKKRDEIIASWNRKYGPENWRIAYTWGNGVIERDFAIQLYEDAYYEFFKANPAKLNWLTSVAADVYDTALTNVEAGFDYLWQETPSTHLQDVAVRRTVIRLGQCFRGDRLIRIRSTDSEGYDLSPGLVPFHLPQLIVVPKIPGWWRPDTVEDFYQSNKILQIRS